MTKQIHQILVAETYHFEALQNFKSESSFKVHELGSDQTIHKLTLELKESITVMLIRSKTKITPDVLALFPKLKVIITSTAGFDHIDLKACKVKGITCYHCPAAHTQSAAELTWALVLACSRNIISAHSSTIKGHWNEGISMGQELSGKTYGVIGLGRIGTRVAQIAKAFGMHLVACDPYQHDSTFESLQIPRSSLEEVLRCSDFVSLHVPLTKETHHLMSFDFLESMPSHSILINTSRGKVVHEPALIEALSHGKIAGAGLDVFEYEPLDKSSKLLKVPRLVLSPHCGAKTHDAFRKSGFEALSILKQHYGIVLNEEGDQGTDKDEIEGILPPRASWYKADF